jgi:hypothetical protein
MKLQTHWQRQFISVSQPMHSMVNSISLQEDQNSLKLSFIPMFLVSPNAPCTNSFWSSSLAILEHSFPGSYSMFSSLSVTTAQLHHQIDREWKCRWAAGHAQRTGSACSGSCLCWSNQFQLCLLPLPTFHTSQSCSIPSKWFCSFQLCVGISLDIFPSVLLSICIQFAEPSDDKPVKTWDNFQQSVPGLACLVQLPLHWHTHSKLHWKLQGLTYIAFPQITTMPSLLANLWHVLELWHSKHPYCTYISMRKLTAKAYVSQPLWMICVGIHLASPIPICYLMHRASEKMWMC